MLVALGLLTVPAVVVPSPQSMVAVKSTGVLLAALVLTKFATRPLNDWPSVAIKVGWSGFTVSTSPSPTIAVLSIAILVKVLGASSEKLAMISNVPSSAYVCVPLMVKGPPVAPLTVPEVVVPSPQSIVEVKSLATWLGLPSSVKLATAPLNGVPSVGVIVA